MPPVRYLPFHMAAISYASIRPAHSIHKLLDLSECTLGRRSMQKWRFYGDRCPAFRSTQSDEPKTGAERESKLTRNMVRSFR